MTQPSQNPIERLYDLANQVGSAVLPDAFNLLLRSIGAPALDSAGITKGLYNQWVQSLLTYVVQNGKFSKFEVVYSPVAPPPFFWNYICGRCAFWQDPKGCLMVEGLIRYWGWCAIFLPLPTPDGKPLPPFRWPLELVKDLPRLVQEAPEVLLGGPAKEFKGA